MYPIFDSLKNTARQMIAKAALAGLLTVPAFSHIGPPIQISLASADDVRIGEPSVIYVVLQAAADIDQAEYQLAAPAGWQIVEGPTQWNGALKSGEKKIFTLRALPLSTEPGALNAVVHVQNQKDVKSTLSADRMGGRFPETSMADGDVKTKNAKRAAIVTDSDEPIIAQFETGVALPQPANATRPQLPGQAEDTTPIREAQTAKNKGSKAAAASFTASGRFTYFDDNNVRRGLRNATVEIWNSNPFPSLGDERCAVGITDSDGNFTLGGNCGDLFDGPDLFARLVLKNSVVEVKPDNLFAGTYTFDSGTKQNSTGGAVNFGTITVTSKRPALQAHNIIMRANQFMASQGESLNRVTVLWPGEGTFYTPVLANITVDPDVPFGEEADLFHEFGHHVLISKAESPIPNYNNGNCDDPNPGHCLNKPELGDIAWTEGWPDFFGAFLRAKFDAAEGYGPTTKYDFENFSASDFPGQEDHVEGVIAAIFWDLTDATNDGRDNLQLSFADTWNVIKNFDPSGNLIHNHPTNIHEFWSGLRQFEFNSINKVSAVYRTNGITKPMPDLSITAIQAPPTILTRNAVFSLNTTVRNLGNETANASSNVRFQLQNLATNAFVTIGNRQVPANLAAGSNNTAPASLTIPAALATGNYSLHVCANSNGSVPESTTTNNCSVATGNIRVQ